MVGLLSLSALSLALYLPLRATASYPVAPIDLPERAGAYIIDMGVVPQTAANGLRPYGLVYDLVVGHQIPVWWAVNGSKAKDGTDFTVTSVNGGGPKTYRGGPFVVAAEYAAEAKPVIDAWKAANPGMVIDIATADFVLPRFETITSWPNAALDEQNGGIAEDYYAAAGIPAAAYDWVDPSLPYNDPPLPFPGTDRLGRCIDIYVMPHADPTWASHHSLLDFNEDGGFIWAACHAVSVLENIADPGDPNPDPDLNFLSASGLVPYGSHKDGTPPYTYAPSGWDPILQFMGILDSATQNGSEQIYLPKLGGWRATTSILAWDGDHPQVPSLSPGAAAVVAYGRGFGDETNGLVMYEAGHTHLKGTTTDVVAAIRAFLNLHLLAGIERRIDLQMSVPSPIATQTPTPVSVVAAGGSGGYTYLWSSSCGGSFDAPTAASTVFRAPAQSGSCTLRVTAHDSCGRTSFGSAVTTILWPPPAPRVTKAPAAGGIDEPGGPVTFSVTVENPGGLEVTLTELTDDVFGDLRDAANPLVRNSTCAAQSSAIPPGGRFSCSFDGDLWGDAGDPDHVDTVTATVEDGMGRGGTGIGTATVSFRDVPPSLTVAKTPSAGSVPEPGGTVTFSVEVRNTSVEPLTLTALNDDRFGDLRDVANPNVANNWCLLQPAVIPVGGTLACSFDAYLAGSAGDPDHADTVTATAVDDEGSAASASDAATVGFDDLLPSITVAKTPSAGSVPEPGGTVTFSVEVRNASVEPVTLTALTDDVYGDLRLPGNPAVANNTCPLQPTVIPVGGTLACSFDAYLAGHGGDPAHADTVTAVARDDEANSASGDAQALVAFANVPATVAVAKTPSVGSVPEPGGTVTFSVEVHNTSVEPLTLTALTDDMFGDLRLPGNPAVANNTCPLQPAGIPVGGTLACSFDAYLAGNAGDPDHRNEATAVAGDDEGSTATDSDTAAVSFADLAPQIDVLKWANPGSVPETGGTVTFQVEVANLLMEPVTLTSLVDSAFGDLRDAGNPSVAANTCPLQPAVIPGGGTLVCSFEAFIAGDFGEPDHTNTVGAAVVDDEGNRAEGTAEAAVAFTDVLPVLLTTKTPSVKAVDEPGGAVSFSVEVANLGREAVVLMSLSDDVFGNLLEMGNLLVEANTCPAQPLVIPAAGSFSCSFQGVVSGGYGDSNHVDNVTAVVFDDDGNSAQGGARAVVAFRDVPPAVAVAKSAAVTAVPEPGATVGFSVEVANLAAEPATLEGLVDDVFGDLLDPANPAVSANTCPAMAPAIGVGLTFTCSFEAYVAGDAGGPGHRNLVTAGVSDDDGNLISAQDDATVAFTDVVAAVAVVKTADRAAVPEPGAEVSFLVEVSNLSVEPVTLISLTDDVFGDLRDAGNGLVTGNNCPDQPAVIPAHGSFVCSFRAYLAGDGGDPDHRDTVAAVLADDEGNRAEASDDAVVAFSDAPPSLSVTKTPSAGSVPEPGGRVTFAVEVHNTSVEPVTLATLTDDVFGDLRFPGNPMVTSNTCPLQPAAIPVGATLACAFEAFIGGDAAGPPHSNTVSATATDDEGNLAADSDDATVFFGNEIPTIEVDKQAAAGSVPEPGGVLAFSVTVRNTSLEEVTLAALTDDVFGDLLDPLNPAAWANTCPAAERTIPQGGAFSCSFHALLVGGAGGPDHLDTVTAWAVDGEGSYVWAADEARVVFADALPTIAVSKAGAPGVVPEPGGVVVFSVEVANLSVEPVALTALGDDVFGDLLDRANPAVTENTCPGTLPVVPAAGIFVCSFEAYVAGNVVGPAHTDTVNAIAQDDEGNPAAASASARVDFADVTPSAAVSKSPALGTLPEPGGAVTFTVEVRNTAVEPVTLETLVDDVFGDLLDPANSAVAANSCPAQLRLLEVGAALTCSFEASLAGHAGDPDHRNTATATVGDDEGNSATASDEAAVAYGDVSPTVDVAKAADPGNVPEPGGVVTFRVTVGNTSPEPVTLEALADDVFGDLLDAENTLVTANDCPGRARSIPAGAALACSFAAWVGGDAGDADHRNTVTATVADDEGNRVGGSAAASVGFDDVPPAVEVAKTASPSTVDVPGGIVTFRVAVMNTSVEPVTLTTLTDSAFGDLRDPDNLGVFENTCLLQPAEIPAGGTLTCEFEAFVEGEGGGPDHVDTVTAAVADNEGNPAAAAASARVAITEIHATVTGHLFVDIDGDAVQGAGEPHLPGVQVRLVDGEGSLRTVTSDALGNWETLLRAGMVSMQVVDSTVPVGYRLTTDNASQTVAVPPGSTTPTGDVGYQAADGSIAGKVFFDVDGNGSQGPGEPPFAGGAVALYKGDRLLLTVVTGSDGTYLFEELAMGPYRVVVRDEAALLAGFRPTLDPDGVLDGETGVTLGTSEHRSGVDFGYRGSGSVGDTIWYDADGDKAQDASEDGIPGVVIGLIWSGFDGALGSPDDVTFAPQTTGPDGTYRFAGMPPGVVAVGVAPASVDADFESTTGIAYVYTLGPGEIYVRGDIGFRARGELPNTGFDAERLGLLSLALIGLGLVLLLAGRREHRRARLPWQRLG